MSKKKTPKRRNATEYLNAFMSWMLTRQNPIILSSKSDIAPVVELIQAFSKANRMPAVRGNYPKVKLPLNTEHYTNEPAPKPMIDSTTAEPMMPDAAAKAILKIIYPQNPSNQDTTIAAVLSHFKTVRTSRLDMARKQQLGAEIDMHEALQNLDNLEKISRGDVAVVYKSPTA